MRCLSFFILFVGVFNLIGQTPMIMHKSLGGTNENFHEAIAHPNSVIRQSNFGLPPTINVKKAVIDSVIVMNDSTVVVVTSKHVVEEIHWNHYEYSTEENAYLGSDSMLIKSLEYDPNGNWQPGRDTLINHPLFNTKLTCSAILKILGEQYRIYENYEKPIVFIGFDCSKQKVKSKQNFLPFIFANLPKDPSMYILMLGILSLLLFLYLQRKSASLLAHSA